MELGSAATACSRVGGGEDLAHEVAGRSEGSALVGVEHAVAQLGKARDDGLCRRAEGGQESIVELQPKVESKANLYLLSTSFFSNLYPFAMINGKEKMKERMTRWGKSLWEANKVKLDGMLKNTFVCFRSKSNKISAIVWLPSKRSG